MLLAALQQVDKFYGEQVVLQSATLEVRGGDRTALIGRNGAGKTTILRLLMDLEAPDGGNVYLRDGVKIAMLEQDPLIDEGATILAVSEQAFKDIAALEQKLQGLERQGLDDPQLFERWEALHEVFERRGGYERRARRDAVLYALGFRGREEESAQHLSGGEKTRLGLARLLMAQPDVLLLDEPTNHLDMEMREWLEGYLSRYPGGVILVSHDREFLDTAASSTAEVSRGTLRTFDDIPTRYRTAREEQERIEAATRANQQKEHARLEAAAAQMKQWAGQNAKLHRRAKAMEKRVDRYEDQMLPGAEPGERTTRFRFPCGPSGELVLQAQHLSKAFAGIQLFNDVSVTVRAGERIALVGPNGAGKTTLLRMLLGDLQSDDPRAALRYGSRVKLGYYDQELKGVDPESTLIDEMIRLVGDVEAHNLLGHFLFPYDAQYKQIRDLSGGERARLALLKLTLGEYNLLVLDEPTNHLDLEMIEALEAALEHYQGTLLIVSHDRRFIQETCHLIWEVREGEFMPYEGDWQFYQRKRAQRRAQEGARDGEQAARKIPQGTPDTRKGPSKWQLERSIEQLESRIAELEAGVAEAAQQLAAPDTLSAEELSQLGETHTRLEQDLLRTMGEWQEAQELLEAKR